MPWTAMPDQMPDKEELAAIADEIERTVQAIKPLLAGKDPFVQSAILGDLVAMWLAGVQHTESPDQRHALREELLASMLVYVRQLVPINEAIFLDRLRRESN